MKAMMPPQWAARWLHNGFFNTISCLVLKKSRAVLNILIGADTTVNSRNGMGISNFQYGVAYGFDDLVETCMDAVEEGSVQEFVNEANPVTGDTPLMMACLTLQVNQV